MLESQIESGHCELSPWRQLQLFVNGKEAGDVNLCAVVLISWSKYGYLEEWILYFIDMLHVFNEHTTNLLYQL